MRLIFLSIVSALLAAVTLGAEEFPVERVFVSTDREVYIAGDMVWCSLFCLDGEGKLSPQSAVSYLELISTEGCVAQVKVGLLGGRGAGSFRIPVNVPTGVYRLVSYTSGNANEDGTPWMAGSRILTIFNTLSTDRVKDGVDIVSEAAYKALRRAEYDEYGQLEFNSTARVRKGADVGVLIQDKGTGADISFSIYHEDDIVPAAQDNTFAGFLESLPASSHPRFIGDRPVDYDGEVISARVVGKTSGDLARSVATLSSAGAPSNLYIGVTDNDRVRFMTNNIYGDREIVCEVSPVEGGGSQIEIESPFISPSSGTLPNLQLNNILYQDLVGRKSSLRAEKNLKTDTLVTMLRHREDLLLESSPRIRYHLDDYNRFPSVREVLVEIIPGLGIRREKGKYVMNMTVSDGTDTYKTRVGNLLVMMDGVVLSDLDMLLDFDAMLLEDIDVYQQAIVCGKVSFSGVANFITKKNYVTALTFPENVRVVDFKGVSYPVAYYGEVPVGVGDDLRQVLYWNPSLRVDAGRQSRVTFKAPGYSGRFRAVAEGLAGDGTPIHHEWTFEVE